MTADANGREVVGLKTAADIAGVTYQTIANWATNGIIHTGEDPDVLRELNFRKTGRKHTRYFYLDEIEANAFIVPGESLMTVRQAAEQLNTTLRTIHRIRDRQGLKTYTGPQKTMYLKREDIDKQKLGVTYFERPEPKEGRTKESKRKISRRTKAATS